MRRITFVKKYKKVIEVEELFFVDETDFDTFQKHAFNGDAELMKQFLAAPEDYINTLESYFWIDTPDEEHENYSHSYDIEYDVEDHG